MRFYCDIMLGRLARYLRILGLDTIYGERINANSLYNNHIKDLRIFTKRRIRGSLSGRVIHISSDNVMEQLKEIKDVILPYIDRKRIMSRCITCNLLLVPVEKKEIEHLVPEFVFHHHEEFKRCPSCKRVFWQGSHTEHMERWIETIFGISE
jgi:hypothetical protein